ncbi:hypothetical protein C922_05496 [Plasmodium inui San Antonio 1]|uniref:Uncharacterized protein n=1 Tax=Plasmodium inui San Antonio 1 TaxID=1237626 RepID=W6ZXX7_9APIC|nr:hypothetical protein C922_05496 [Plasmodium inui San Antonio 1]EUD64125.1 hypothetical protein C922_05496 [Plasmodium inui San Antonio 1]
MSNWRVSDYLQQVLGAGGTNRGSIPHTQEGGGASRLRSQTNSSPTILTRWQGINEAFEGQEAKVESVWKYSSGVCMGLDVWGWNLTRTEEGIITYESGNCTPGATGYGRGTGGRTQACQGSAGDLQWSHFKGQREYKDNNRYQREFFACRELVTILLGVFGMTNTGARDASQVAKGNPCGKFYDIVKKWGGVQIANQIMDDWFLDQGNSPPRSRLFGLKVGDLYERISEFLYGDDKGDKALYCTYNFDEGSGQSLGHRKYTTGENTGSSLGQCNSTIEECLGHLDRSWNTEQDTPGEVPQTTAQVGSQVNGEKTPTSAKPVKDGSGMDGQVIEQTRPELDRPEGGGSDLDLEGNAYGSFSPGAIVGGLSSSLLFALGLYGYYRIFLRGRFASKGREGTRSTWRILR